MALAAVCCQHDGSGQMPGQVVLASAACQVRWRWQVTPAELRAAGRLSGQFFSGGVSRVELVHQAISGRAFGPLRQAGAPARRVHDVVAGGVYAAIRGAGLATGAVGGAVVSRFGAGGQSVSAAPGGNLALSAVNAIAGDRLGTDLAPLAISLAVRVAGHDIELSPRQLASDFPAATPRLAVFVHGLAETEDSWQRRDEVSVPYGQRLQADYGYTPVYLRYNTGRHVSANGHDLADLLSALTAAWPTEVTEVLLVGHSMGGLVIRSACHYGEQRSAAWTQLVRHVFYLGAPHLGAPAARAAGFSGLALGLLAETRPFVSLVNGSSAGIKDLRYGYLLDDDWADCDQDSCLRDHRRRTPLLAGANHHVISATVTADPSHRVGALVGDLLVQPASAHGRHGDRQVIGFAAKSGREVGGAHHFDLLNHAPVWAAMRGLLESEQSETQQAETRQA